MGDGTRTRTRTIGCVVDGQDGTAPLTQPHRGCMWGTRIQTRRRTLGDRGEEKPEKRKGVAARESKKCQEGNEEKKLCRGAVRYLHLPAFLPFTPHAHTHPTRTHEAATSPTR